MKESEVYYTTEDPAPQYLKQIRSASSKEALIKILEEWRWIANDAYLVAKNITNWEQFKKELNLLRKSDVDLKSISDEAIIVTWPRQMLELSVMASYLKVPWGTAYRKRIRLNQNPNNSFRICP